MTERHPPGRPTLIARRVGAVLGVVELAIGAVMLLAILALVFLQAAQRYLPFEQFAWTGELARFAMVWLTFVVMGLLVTLRGHIALEIVDIIPNRMIVRIVQTFALAVVAATGVGLTVEAIALIATQGILKSPVLRMPMSWLYVPILFGALSTTLRAAVGAIDVAWHGPVLPETTDAAAHAGPADTAGEGSVA